MNRKEEKEHEAGLPTEETSEQLNDQILKMQERLAEKELQEAAENFEEIELPVAKAMIRTNSQSSVPIAGITPPEALVLAAMHGPGAGGRVFEKIEKTGTVKTNAAYEKMRLAGKYGSDRVDKLFPGAEPKLPGNFILAVKIGLGTVLPMQRLFDTKVKVGI